MARFKPLEHISSWRRIANFMWRDHTSPQILGFDDVDMTEIERLLEGYPIGLICSEYKVLMENHIGSGLAIRQRGPGCGVGARVCQGRGEAVGPEGGV